MPKNPVGRPMKYADILRALDRDGLYSPAAISVFAEEHGFLQSDPKDREAIRLEKLRIRMTMGRYTANHGFPKEGDGHYKMKGRAPFRAWKGSRWQADLPD